MVIGSARREPSMNIWAGEYFWKIATGTVAMYLVATTLSVAFAIEQSILG